jgi:hypothetical protein
MEKTYFAKVADGIVQDVICADQTFVDNIQDTTPGKWIQTWKDGGIRKNYANKGHLYDRVRDMFYYRQPYPSWTLNEETGRWEPPIPMPGTDSNLFFWNEEGGNWEEVAES